jgi:quinolinate synthase
LQIPDLHVWYGPDTYMGRNLVHLFEILAAMPDDAVAALHPGHTAASVRAWLPRLHHFTEGTCIVHEVFGGETCALVRRRYPDAYITAHFEARRALIRVSCLAVWCPSCFAALQRLLLCSAIACESMGSDMSHTQAMAQLIITNCASCVQVPGEMFSLALEAKQQRGMGVVGSTSNILNFIAEKVAVAVERGFKDHLQFVLGTEAGMITSIVRRVQGMLRAKGAAELGIDVEIVFPVAPDAITTPETASRNGAAPVQLPGGLQVVPGPASGEGCSLEGGCAACPYMKMNTLGTLLQVCERFGDPAGEAMLAANQPRAHTDLVRVSASRM